MSPIIVAIDGPAGAGKSTAAFRLAESLGYLLLDTGALYRAIALIATRAGVDWSAGPKLARLAKEADIRFKPGAKGERPQLWIGNEDCSKAIRTPEISQGASKVSQHPEVRSALLSLQRNIGTRSNVVVEGRDIGTVVFPNAQVKVFLTASVQARAARRHQELRAKNQPTDLQQLMREIEERDHRDRTRTVAPLIPAEDATIIDSTELDLVSVVNEMASIVRERTAKA